MMELKEKEAFWGLDKILRRGGGRADGGGENARGAHRKPLAEVIL